MSKLVYVLSSSEDDCSTVYSSDSDSSLSSDDSSSDDSSSSDSDCDDVIEILPLSPFDSIFGSAEHRSSLDLLQRYGDYRLMVRPDLRPGVPFKPDDLKDQGAASKFRVPSWCQNLPSHVREEIESTKRLSLHNEILLFSDRVRPGEAEQAAITWEIERLREIVKSVWVDVDVRVFGSVRSGLALPMSDIDVVLVNIPDYVRASPLRVVANALRRNGYPATLKLIEHARVPIIKLETSRFHYQMDISMEHNGTSQLAIISRFNDIFLPFRPLVLLLKLLLAQRDLNEPFRGGVGSYLVTLMVASFLQNYPAYRFSSSAPGIQDTLTVKSFNINAIDLGTLLLDFLEFYAIRFNYYTSSLSLLGHGGYVQKPEGGSNHKCQPDQIYCRDPNDETNDVGKPSYNIERVRDLFLATYHQLHQAAWSSNPSKRSTLTLLQIVVKPYFEQRWTIFQENLQHRLLQAPPAPIKQPSFTRSGPSQPPPPYRGANDEVQQQQQQQPKRVKKPKKPKKPKQDDQPKKQHRKERREHNDGQDSKRPRRRKRMSRSFSEGGQEHKSSKKDSKRQRQYQRK